ncbi:hypothetical protein TNCV_1308281 [Trichonephila clavipes]|nr:hypothetical protein TNCV_1308281 [Trichonephila clavipes]
MATPLDAAAETTLRISTKLNTGVTPRTQDSAGSMTINLSVTGGTEENVRDQLAFFIGIQAAAVNYLLGLGDVFLQQENATPHISRRVLTYRDTRGIRSCLGRNVLRICLPLKTSRNGLLRDWVSPPLQLLRLMMNGADLKQNGKFDLIHNLVRAVLTSRGGSCMY